MYYLYLDAFLLACPKSSTNIQEFEEYLNSLIKWGEEIDNMRDAGLASIYLSAQIPEVLAKSYGYPDWDELDKIIKNLNMQDVIHPHDIFVLIDGLLRLPYIEDQLSINEILLDNFQCEPSFHLNERDEIFVEIHYRLTALIFLMCHFESVLEKNQILITRHNDDQLRQISISGEIIDCEFFTDSRSIQYYPYPVSILLNYFIKPESLYYYFDALDIWVSATSDELYVKAINIYVIQMNYSLQKSKSKLEMTSWSFGNRFIRTAKDLGFLNDQAKAKMLLRSCAETILKENLSDTHWLRTGKGANNPQRKREKDKALAWRRDIDREYHLHYWETAKGVEFASVVVHNDMKIPE